MKRFTKKRWLLLIPGLALVVCGTAGAGYYYRFYHHVTAEEVSHSVQHSDFEAQIRGNHPITLQVYQQSNAKNQQLILFTSGDGGWSPFCADIAAHLAATGRTVVGFDSKDYLTTFASSEKPALPEDLVRDYQSILSAALERPGIDTGKKVILSGWSLGAGYSVLAAASPEIKSRVERVLAISLPVDNELAWKPTDAVIYITHGTPKEKVFDAHDYLSKMNDTPVVIFNASDDDTSPTNNAQSLYASGAGPKKLYIVKASGHHFEGGETEFYKDLDAAINEKVPSVGRG